MRDVREIVTEWRDAIYDEDPEAFLDFAEGLNINEFVIENGVRTIWLEDGMYYIAHGACIRETDSPEAKEIIDALEDYGIDFDEVG